MPAQLSIPDGPGPFPVIILLHACADPVGGEMHEWVERMKS
jgi:dienelactone hydrolase